jgi:hypothetical protein
MEIGFLLNLVLAAFAITFLLQIFSIKRRSRVELVRYENLLKDEIEKNRNLNEKGQGSNELLLKIENLHQEKEKESQLRLQAEKQIELALQKTGEVEKKVEDWQAIQEANLKDATEAMAQISEDLYKKLEETYKTENDALIEQLDDSVRDIYDYLERITLHLKAISPNSQLDDENMDDAEDTKSDDSLHLNSKSSLPQLNNDFNKSLEDLLQSADLAPGSDYFMKYDLPEVVRKSVPCDSFIVLSEESAIIVDLKSAKFFSDLFLSKENDQDSKEDAEAKFKQQINRYLNYLTSLKYRSNIINYFSKKGAILPHAQYVIVILVPSQREVEEFEGLGESYAKTLEDNNILLHSFDSLQEIIFG